MSPYADVILRSGEMLAERMNRLLAGSSDAGVELLNRLLENTLNAFGEKVAYEIIAALNPSQIISFLIRRSQFVSRFVKLRPALACDAQFWRALQSRSHEILESLAPAAKEKPEMLAGVSAALFASGLEYEASHFVNLFGTVAAQAIFARREFMPVTSRNRWLDALAARPEIILEAINGMASLTPEVLSGVAVTYRPSRAATGPFPLEAWKAGMVDWAPDFSPQVRVTVEVCVFTLAVALRNRSPIAADLAVLSFETAHTAARIESMTSAAWSSLEPVVPSISFFRDWDRCERMRRALIEAFCSGYWPLDRFFPMLLNPRTLREVINSAVHLSEGRDLMKKLVVAIKTRQVVPDAAQLNILRDALDG